MTAVTRDDYESFRRNILNNRHGKNDYLQQLKFRYQNEINSTRRYNEISDISQLISVLEKRDCVSEHDITILNDIASVIGLESYANRTHFQNNEPTEINRNVCNPPTRNFVPNEDEVKRRVYNTLTTKLGGKWIDFARNLKIVESKIDSFKMTYLNNSELCVREVLQYHEENCVPREWKNQLLKALEKARRNDLRNEVLQIYVDFS